MGGLKEAVARLDRPTHFSSYTFLLKECGNAKALPEGRHVHGRIIRFGLERDRFLGNLLVDMYRKCGSLPDARFTFDQMQDRNLYSWNIMIAAYTQHSHCHGALQLFNQMQQEEVRADKFTFGSVLGACSSLAALSEGRDVHACIVDEGLESDVFMVTALVNMYGKCGSLEDARELFDKLHIRDAITWNAMITAYSQRGHDSKALQLYQKMEQEGVKPKKVTFISALGACSGTAVLPQGKIMHGSIIDNGFESDVLVATALVNMYSKCGSLEDAQIVFDRMCQHDVVSWSAMISAYTLHGKDKEALHFFLQMQNEGMKPDNITFVSIFGACANMAALPQGRETHANVVECACDLHTPVGNALINMYGKCGCLMDAQWVFDNMSVRNVISWTGMIEVQAYSGHARVALQLFSQMLEEGVVPNDVTFVNVLSACSHAGLVNEGCDHFKSMTQMYDIEPTMEHYGCMVDLYGRSGLLEEAENFIHKMPFQPNAVIWEALLSACRVHNDVNRGKHAAEHGIELDSQIASPYVLLSNIYSAEGRWDDAARVRKLMVDRGLNKQPGCSVIEIQDRVHEFYVRDRSHPQTQEIYTELERLRRQMESLGFVADTRLMLHDVEEELKEPLLWYHSEKLAIAFGLISTPPGTPLRIIKNLRVCPHCHAAAKFISKLVDREIILRDSSHFHQFQSGSCSCGGFW